MQTFLVAGGAGFIGSHLCEVLVKRGYKVISVDNLISGDKENLSALFNNPSFSFIEHDITSDFEIFKKKLPPVNYVFHLASPASPNKKSPRSYINHPIETLLANSLGTKNLLDIAKANNANFLFASSSEIYGDPDTSVQSEEYFGNVNPVGVRSVYDEGKRFGEAITMAYVRTHNVSARIVRIFNTYGPRMSKDDGRVVSNFVTQALGQESITIYGDGQQTRSFCYISDMVEGIISTILSDGTKGVVINLGNPDERNILELATMVKSLTGSKSQIVFEELPEDDPRIRKPDIGKAKKILGWNPVVSLDEGLNKTIEYFTTIM